MAPMAATAIARIWFGLAVFWSTFENRFTTDGFRTDKI
jgi:hypothetical protein